jgi:hypothetical protein
VGADADGVRSVLRHNVAVVIERRIELEPHRDVRGRVNTGFAPVLHPQGIREKRLELGDANRHTVVGLLDPESLRADPERLPHR